MKKILAFVILFLLFYLNDGEGSIPAKPPIQYRSSIGVNKLPWDAWKVSFRRWDGSKGREFSIGAIDFEMESQIWERNSSLKISLSELAYNWLWRREAALLEGLFITRGIGLTLPFSFYWGKRKREDISPYFSEYISIYIPLPLAIPVGIEHFFLKKYPISYSLEADFQAGFRYSYRFEQYREVSEKWELGRFSLSISPRFFFRLYFR